MRVTVLCVVLASALVSACGGGSPAAPRNEPVGALTISCYVENAGWRCNLRVDLEPGVSRDVTGLAAWSTSDPRIAVVNSVGFITILQPGEFAIRASYGGDEIAMILGN